MPTTIIVLGYGCILSPTLKQYLDAVARYVRDNPDVSLIITTGGFTDPLNAPGVSEAGLMADYLRPQLESFPGLEIIEENRARTTIENLRFTKEILQGRGLLAEPIVVFGDYYRHKRIRMLARQILRQNPRLVTAELTSGLLSRMFQLHVMPIVSYVVARNRWLENGLLRAQRIIKTSPTFRRLASFLWPNS